MSGEELKKKLEGINMSFAKMAELMGVFPQSFNKTLQADDVKSGFIEKLARVLNKDLGYFYDLSASTEKENEELSSLRKMVSDLQQENERLKEDLRMKEDPDIYKKESEVYHLWMEHMKLSEQQMALSERMHELYKKQKEG